MSAKALPALKVGGVYFHAWVDDAHKVEIAVYVLRTIRGRCAYLVERNEWTWIKTGHGKRATWGWAPRINACWRTKLWLSQGIPDRYARSPSQAVRVAIRNHVQGLKDYPETDPALLEGEARDLAALRRRLAHEMRKKTA